MVTLIFSLNVISFSRENTSFFHRCKASCRLPGAVKSRRYLLPEQFTAGVTQPSFDTYKFHYFVSWPVDLVHDAGISECNLQVAGSTFV
jgi:hypothetical protein